MVRSSTMAPFFSRTAKLTGAVVLPRLGGKPGDHAGNASAAPAAADVPPTDDVVPRNGYGPPAPTRPQRTHDAASLPQPTDGPGHAAPDPARRLYGRWHDTRDRDGCQRTVPSHCWSAAGRPPCNNKTGPTNSCG